VDLFFFLVQGQTRADKYRSGAAVNIIPATWRDQADTAASPFKARFLIIVAALIPLTGIYAPKGLVWVALAVAIVASMSDFRAGRFGINWPQPLAWIFASIVVWGGASILWAVRPDESLSKLLDLTAIIAGTLALISAARTLSTADSKRLTTALTLGLVLALTVLLAEITGGTALIGLIRDTGFKSSGEIYSLYNRGIGVAALMVWPAALALTGYGHRIAGLVLILACLVLALAFNALSVAIALMAGAACCLIMLAGVRRFALALAVAAPVLILTHPFAMHAGIDRFAPPSRAEISQNISINHRFIIWEFTSQKILERPLLGWGFNASRSLPGAQKTVPLLNEPNAPVGELISLHPHNAILQWWLELGLIGAALAGLLAASLFRCTDKLSDTRARALACGQLVTGLGIASLSFGAWQSWWLASLALSAFFLLLVTARPRAET
jgi:exopolysaccharide production protein ExoQ